MSYTATKIAMTIQARDGIRKDTIEEFDLKDATSK